MSKAKADHALNAEIGNRELLRRQKLGVSQQDVATACGLTRAMVCNIEAGRGLSVVTLVALAAALDVPVGHLLENARARGKTDTDWRSAATDRVNAAMGRKAVKRG